jgi:hypothetical protein
LVTYALPPHVYLIILQQAEQCVLDAIFDLEMKPMALATHRL